MRLGRVLPRLEFCLHIAAIFPDMFSNGNPNRGLQTRPVLSCSMTKQQIMWQIFMWVSSMRPRCDSRTWILSWRAELAGVATTEGNSWLMDVIRKGQVRWLPNAIVPGH